MIWHEQNGTFDDFQLRTTSRKHPSRARMYTPVHICPSLYRGRGDVARNKTAQHVAFMRMAIRSNAVLCAMRARYREEMPRGALLLMFMTRRRASLFTMTRGATRGRWCAALSAICAARQHDKKEYECTRNDGATQRKQEDWWNAKIVHTMIARAIW